MLFNENDPALARRYGSLITVAATAAGVLFGVGIARRSYWALAVPICVVVGGIVSGGVILGRLLATTPDEVDDPLP